MCVYIYIYRERERERDIIGREREGNVAEDRPRDPKAGLVEMRSGIGHKGGAQCSMSPPRPRWFIYIPFAVRNLSSRNVHGYNANDSVRDQHGRAIKGGG